MESIKLTDIFNVRRNKIVFFTTFVLYFLFYQYVDRILLVSNVLLPQGVNVIVTTSTPVPPSQMPYPLWGPFLAITTRYFDWAMTPLSLGISFILSFLVALNVTLYVALFSLMRTRTTHKLAVSLGLLATSLSCSCELFTALIGATVSNIPFLVSIAFMDTLGELLTIVAGVILTISSLVIASEITGSNPFAWMKWNHGVVPALVFTGAMFLIPSSETFFLVRIIDGLLAGGIWGYILSRKLTERINLSQGVRKTLFLASVVLVSIQFLLFPLMPIWSFSAVSLLAGLLGSLGYTSLKPWVRLGLLHVIGWSLIMPGPISLILGSPIPFYNITGGQAILLWITAWIFGTPIAWLAGIQYLQYIRDKMSQYSLTPSQLRIPQRSRTDGLTWIALGGVAVFSQIVFFMTHSAYFLDYNGYDLVFLETMTLSATGLMIAGLVLMGYGGYLMIKSRYTIPKINRKYFVIASVAYAIVEMLVTKMMIIAPTGYPYPPVLLLTYGEPMYAPAVTIYVPGIIGFYLYPASVLALIASSVLSGAIWALVFQTRRRNLGSLTAFSVLTACPSCGLSAVGYAVTSVVTASSALMTFYGDLGFTLASVGILVGLLVYVIKSTTTCRVDVTKIRQS
ncbi:hypothetical protein HA72_0474 [Metallosphaera sedula]|uniref:Uncharacterized protein n=2 Tax=Metallosphaera sedula TaxID=43687 RepID=A4YDZ9_METS5|nr:hypothetical protein [Metallosphaera sedula]MCY0862893.1 hypothetical protein [Metallosphaera prunae]ABP94651.1 hypothetical protein Msed_0474 [Metallosphaera sedula DSM 5348]AIM26638.1 hypothetical protein HA72_0474 [Metallosphaera sedula]AKV73614.1 hypothetical protein MsedA_0488 [Metallosphaera sedula]AKV75855.1 hypothetical protein MsedB_0488 [Metallosphaera sedula]